MAPIKFERNLDLFQFPATPSKIHDRILKLLILLISYIPLLAFLIISTVGVGRKPDQVCLFRHGTGGAVPCFAVSQLEFEKKTRPLDLLLGPFINYMVKWQVTCLKVDLMKEDYALVDRSQLIGKEFVPPVVLDLTVFDYGPDYERKGFRVDVGSNCFIEDIYRIENLVFVELLEIAILAGVAVYYVVHYFLPGNSLPFVYSLITFVVNLEVLGLAPSMLIQLIITLILSLYVKILNKYGGKVEVETTEV